MFDGILFDLDGTLWDAVPEIIESWNLTLRRAGVERTLTAEELRPCMGMLHSDIAARLLPGVPHEEQLPLIELCCAEENEYLRRVGAATYPGEEEALEVLSKRCPLFVVSNCQDGYIEAYYEGTGMGKYFTGCRCAGPSERPKAENIALLVQEYGLKRPVYVGDTPLDYASATAAGLPFVHAAYGFGKVEGVPAIRSLKELPDLLEKLGG